MKTDIPLLLFAKAPISGQVKTRLMSHCSADQAAKIAEILIEQSLKLAIDVWPGKVLLGVWGAQEHPFIIEMLERYDVQLLPQVSGDLGQKMSAAFSQVGYPAAILGCDVPHIPAATLRDAYQRLIDGGNVIGPSEDGGYYLIGLSEACPSIFQNIEWGGDSVLAKTLESAAQAQLDTRLLAELFDIDRWQDVIRAAEQLDALNQFVL